MELSKINFDDNNNGNYVIRTFNNYEIISEKYIPKEKIEDSEDYKEYCKIIQDNENRVFFIYYIII